MSSKNVIKGTFIHSYIHATLYLGSLIVYAVILNQKLINKSRKKEARSFKPLHKKRKKKDSEKESVKLTTDIDKPFTMVIDNYCQIMNLKSNTVLTLQKFCAVIRPSSIVYTKRFLNFQHFSKKS